MCVIQSACLDILSRLSNQWKVTATTPSSTTTPRFLKVIYAAPLALQVTLLLVDEAQVFSKITADGERLFPMNYFYTLSIVKAYYGLDDEGQREQDLNGCVKLLGETISSEG